MVISSSLRHLEDIRVESLRTALKHLLTDPAPEGDIREYYNELFSLFYSNDARAMVELLTALEFAGFRKGPEGRWIQFAQLPPAKRRNLLRGIIEATFSAPDGTTLAAMALPELPTRQDRIQWFVDKHDLNKSTTATYAERIYRTVTEFLDTPPEPGV